MLECTAKSENPPDDCWTEKEKADIGHSFRLNVTSEKLWQRFQQEFESRRDHISLRNCFTRMAPEIHKTSFDIDSKTEFYLAFKVPVEKSILTEMNKRGIVCLFTDGCLKSFVENPKFAVKQEIEKEVVQPKKTPRQFTKQEHSAMWEYFLRRTRHPLTGKMMKTSFKNMRSTFWRDYVKETSTARKAPNLHTHFLGMIHRIQQSNLDLPTKASIFYALDYPLDPDFYKDLKRAAAVKIDKENHLVWYRTFDGKHEEGVTNGENETMETETDFGKTEVKEENDGQQMDADLEPGSNQSEPLENPLINRIEFIWDFVLYHMNDLETGELRKLSEEQWRVLFAEYYEDDLYDGTQGFKYFVQNVAPNLHQLTRFDAETKLKFYYSLDYPINLEFLATLETSVEVHIDDRGCVERYTWNPQPARERALKFSRIIIVVSPSANTLCDRIILLENRRVRYNINDKKQPDPNAHDCSSSSSSDN
ncbi:unnamed protein product [Caenorhabditis sp. 36 PRJEB53466]|nr:unnamed protein product [Caenorhabditis sp. 36 PRJEB53466]